MTVYERMKELRKKSGMSQGELADKIGYLCNSAISKIELGYRDISLNTLSKYAEIFGVSETYLLHGSEADVPAIVTENDIKVALFGCDVEVTDDMWREVKNFADYIKSKKGEKY